MVTGLMTAVDGGRSALYQHQPSGAMTMTDGCRTAVESLLKRKMLEISVRKGIPRFLRK